MHTVSLVTIKATGCSVSKNRQKTQTLKIIVLRNNDTDYTKHKQYKTSSFLREDITLRWYGVCNSDNVDNKSKIVFDSSLCLCIHYGRIQDTTSLEGHTSWFWSQLHVFE